MLKPFEDKLNLLSHLCMVALMAASIYYSQERMLHTDNANMTFWLINTKDFSTAHGRFPVYLTQFLIILGIKLKLSVKALIVLYSFNFYLLYYLAYLATVFLYKNATLGYLIPLSLVIMTHDIFFLQTEVMHGIVFAFLFAAYLLHEKPRNNYSVLYHIVGAGAFVIAAFFHQISCIFLLIVTGWYFLYSRNFTSAKAYVYLLVTLGIITYKTLDIAPGTYEGNYYRNAPGIKQAILHFTQTDAVVFYRTYMESVYLAPSILLLICILLLVWKREYLAACFIATSFAAYFILIASMFVRDSQIMMERIYLPLGAIICLAVALLLKEAVKLRIRPVLTLSVLTLVFVIGMNNIVTAAPKYTRRLSMVKLQAEKMQQQNGHRFYTFTKDADSNNEFPFWAASCEQFLYSAVHYPGNLKTMYLFNDSAEAAQTLDISPLQPNEFLYAPFAKRVDTAFLNPDYFIIKHDPYQYINFN